MAKLSATTKMVGNPYVINQLKDASYAAGEEFLRSDIDNVGKTSSVDLRAMFA
jgi:NTE family protein